jgi:tripartite-type tricarboxylate transporter receptor subunit TctC
MRLRRRRFIQLATSVAVLSAGSRLSRAQAYPSRSITVVVPFPPGGSTDVAGRILADRMAAALGQPVIIENVGGAGGSIGLGRVARAIPDGYTIDIGQWDTHVAVIIYNVNFDLQAAFAPIGLISLNPQLLVARRAFPADDVKSLVAWMKAHPGEAKLVNQVAAAQVGRLLLEKLTDTKVLFVPYRGAGPGMTDLISGQVDLMIAQAAVMMPQVRAGTIKALVNLSPQRSSSIADIPASDEAGVPGLYLSGWFGLFAPRATPPDIIAKLNSAMVQALAEPAVQQRFKELGLDIASREQQTPEALAAFHKAEVEKWWPIIKAAGLRGD